MTAPRDRLNLIRHFARMLRQHGDGVDATELEVTASAIELQAELALAELEALPMSLPVATPRSVLSAREMQVLKLVSDGLPDKQIAKLLGISTFTVNKHVSAILLKMQASSRTEASVRAILEGFVQPRAS